MLQPTPDDLAWLAKNKIDDEVKQRILMERAVIRKACDDLIAAGYWLRLDDGQGWITPSWTQQSDEIMADLLTCDVELLRVTLSPPFINGSLTLIYGNDGWDVMADYSASLEPHLAGANALADQLCDQLHTNN